MPIFKAPNNDTRIANAASEGWVEITQQELEAIHASRQSAPQVPSIQSQIDELERAQLMPRVTREFMLLSMEGMATPEQLDQNFGYKAVKAFDLQIADLRAQL